MPFLWPFQAIYCPFFGNLNILKVTWIHPDSTSITKKFKKGQKRAKKDQKVPKRAYNGH